MKATSRRRFTTAAPLQGKPDRYKGITISTESLPEDPTKFKSVLAESLETWKIEGIRGVWLKIPTEKCQLVEPAIKEGGFTLHHAQPGYIMLTNWLSKDENKMPAYASHYIGVGGLVFNSDHS